MTTYTLPDLPFAYDACEPWCSAEIMELHHQKHHAAYVDGANKALATLAGLNPSDAAQLAGVQQTLTFNVSGHVLHSLFWESITPVREKPEGELLAAIDDAFGSVARMGKLLTATSMGIHGSGWGALTWDPTGERLHVVAIHDHQQDQLTGGIPVAVLDVWEHAYYLQYRSDRAGWVAAASEHFSWSAIATRLAAAREHVMV